MKNTNDYSCTLLKLERRKQNKGQKEVCHGICVPSYLSKIERNQVKPDPAIIRQLFQRLGIEFFCEEDFIRRNQTLIDQYFEQLTYGLEKTAYQELLPHDKELAYSPLAIDWLLIQAYEGGKDLIMQLSECTGHMNDVQLAYYYMLLQLKKGEDDNTIQLYMRAFYILNNSFSLINLMQAYYLKGQYDKVREYSDKCISLALEEGNTCNLALCYSIVGNVYACMNIIDLMMPFYNRAIHLLFNTGWKEQLETVYYNIGATLIADKKYELAMQYLDKVNWEDDFLLSHKKALILIRSGKQDEAGQYIGRMKQWVNDHDTAENPAAVEQLMLEEALFEGRKDFLADPQYIVLMEKLMERLHHDRHMGYVNFYQEVLKKAYCRQRKYKKALDLYD